MTAAEKDPSGRWPTLSSGSPYPLPPDDCDYDQLDPGIREAVRVLRAAGVETYESCEGGIGHAFPAPTIRFHGPSGWHALGVANMWFRVAELRRTWDIIGQEPTGPCWEIVRPCWEIVLWPPDGWC